MLVDLNFNLESIEDRKAYAKKEGITYFPQNTPELRVEKGIYKLFFSNIPKEEVLDELDDIYWSSVPYSVDPENVLSYYQTMYEGKLAELGTYGVADNVEQVKEHFKYFIEHPDYKFIITLQYIHHKRDRGFRWHKNGPYIGTRTPEYEHLGDEEFDYGDGFPGVICYNLLRVLD